MGQRPGRALRGLGIGAALGRHESSPHRLFAQDLLFPGVLEERLGSIRQYYRERSAPAHARGQVREVRRLLVMRGYLTRHGAGPLPGEDEGLALAHTTRETNTANAWQGGFRRAPWNEELARYARACEEIHGGAHPTGLLLTCLDQTPEGRVLVAGTRPLESRSAADWARHLGFSKADRWVSRGPTAEDVVAL